MTAKPTSLIFIDHKERMHYYVECKHEISPAGFTVDYLIAYRLLSIRQIDTLS